MSADAAPEAKPASRNGSVEKVLTVLRMQGPCSQAVLARQTGLSKGTINNVVKKLLSESIVSLQQKNRKEALVILGTGLGYVATVEIRSEKIKATLFDFSNERRFDVAMALGLSNADSSSSPGAVVQALQVLCQQAGVDIQEISCVSLAIQAPIDRATGSIVDWATSRLPAWKDIRLAEWFTDQLGVPVIVDNDANLAALSEWTWGCGRGVEDFFYLYCSEGVGGAIILGGKIYRGGTGVAGEVGHMILGDSGPVCFCGGRGCLHSLVSERAILAALDGSESPQDSLAGVIEAARRGDAACRRVLFEAGRSLGRAVANTARVIAPSVIAIGGTLSTADELLTDSLKSAPEILNVLSISSATKLHLAVVSDAVTLGSVAAALSYLTRGINAIPGWMHPVTSDDPVEIA